MLVTELSKQSRLTHGFPRNSLREGRPAFPHLPCTRTKTGSESHSDLARRAALWLTRRRAGDSAPYLSGSRVAFASISIGFLLAAWPLVAGESGGYEGREWAFMDAKSVRSAAAEITLTHYPDCDEATVDKKMVRVYRPDGTGECQDESFVKVLTEKGKRNNRLTLLRLGDPIWRCTICCRTRPPKPSKWR